MLFGVDFAALGLGLGAGLRFVTLHRLVVELCLCWLLFGSVAVVGMSGLY